MSRGVDVDAIALFPAPGPGALNDAVNEAFESGYARLKSISELQLDELMEWILPGQRCVAVTEPRNGWQLLYDTTFSHAALSDSLSRALPQTLIVQFNLQEGVDLTLRVLQNDSAVYEYSSAPSFFNWGRCVGKPEAARIERADAPEFISAIGRPLNESTVRESFKTIVAKIPGEPKGPRGRKSGVYDAMQNLAAEMGTPRLYRFFEGWLKSDLDWDEDDVVDVLAYKRQ